MNIKTKLICILASFYLMTLCVPGAFGAERVYDFSNDDAWEPIQSEWKVVNGEYVVTHDGQKVGVAVLKEAEGIDTSDVESIAVMGYDLGTAGWKNALIVFGFDENNLISYIIGPTVGNNQAWSLLLFESKTRIWPNARLKEHKEILRPLRWYHVKLVFDGDTIILYGAEGEDDLEEKLQYKFPGGRPSGRIGVGGIGSDAKFDDFRVIFENPDDKSKGRAVEFKDKLPVAWGRAKIGFGS